MKFIINKNELLETLTNVMRAISPRNIIPILNGVKFDLKKEGLYITASDSDLTIQAFIEKEKIKQIEKTGTIIIQAKYLLDIIRKLPDEDINIEVIDSLKIVISTNNTIFNLNCLNTEDYPEITFEEVKDPIIIKADQFKEMINQTIFSISTQESRPILTGVNLTIEDKKLNCIATDSYRLSKKTIDLGNSYEEANIVIPGKNLNEFNKLLIDENNVDIHIFINKIIFKYNNYIFQSNLLSGSYPNTSQLIPTDFAIILTTSLKDYNSAIDRAALLTQSKEKNIVKMEIKTQEVLITSFASEIGKVEETVKVEKNSDEEISISFSSKYMLEALRTFEDDDLLILLNNDSSAMVLKSIKDESLIQLILPIRTY